MKERSLPCRFARHGGSNSSHSADAIGAGDGAESSASSCSTSSQSSSSDDSSNSDSSSDLISVLWQVVSHEFRQHFQDAKHAK